VSIPDHSPYDPEHCPACKAAHLEQRLKEITALHPDVKGRMSCSCPTEDRAYCGGCFAARMLARVDELEQQLASARATIQELTFTTAEYQAGPSL